MFKIFIYSDANYKLMKMKKISKYISFWISFSVLFLIISTTVLGSPYPSKKGCSFDKNYIIEMIEQINETRVLYFYEKLMMFGVRYTGTQNCSMAGDWIYEEFDKIGLDVEFHQWEYRKFEDRNVIATLHGNDSSSNAIFIICAHYDTVENSPGANDDGSGVVAILSIAEKSLVNIHLIIPSSLLLSQVKKLELMVVLIMLVMYTIEAIILSLC